MKVNIIQEPEIKRIIKQTINVNPLWDETKYLRKQIYILREEIEVLTKSFKELEEGVYNGRNN